MREYYAEDIREVRRNVQNFFDEHRLGYAVIAGIDFYSGHIYLKFRDAKGAEVDSAYIYKYYEKSLNYILTDAKLMLSDRVIKLLIADNQILRDFNNQCWHDTGFWSTPNILELELL